jgi:hypothetical protein
MATAPLGRPYESLRSTALFGTSDDLTGQSPPPGIIDNIKTRRNIIDYADLRSALSFPSCSPDIQMLGRLFRAHPLFLLAPGKNFRFLSSLSTANMVWLYFPPDRSRPGQLDRFYRRVNSSFVPDYADKTRS